MVNDFGKWRIKSIGAENGTTRVAETSRLNPSLVPENDRPG